MGAPGAADVLDGEGLERRPVGDAVILLQPVDLQHLAAQPDQQDGAEIRVCRRAPQRALEDLEAFAAARHAAAAGVGDRHDAVDMGKVAQQSAALGRFGDVPRHRRRGSSRSSARRYCCASPPAVGAAIAQEAARRLAPAPRLALRRQLAQLRHTARFWVWTCAPPRCPGSRPRSPGRICAPRRRSRCPPVAILCPEGMISRATTSSPAQPRAGARCGASRSRHCRSDAGVPLRHHWSGRRTGELLGACRGCAQPPYILAPIGPNARPSERRRFSGQGGRRCVGKHVEGPRPASGP